MASSGEDDDIEDLEALRKAALATLKPKGQTIEQVISTGGPRGQKPEWSDVPASVDYPGFSDPVPEPSPYIQSPRGMPVNQTPLPKQPLIAGWRGGRLNGVSDTRSRYHMERRPFPPHPRAPHRTFGDRGRPLYDRGRRVLRGGYVVDRGRFSLTNHNQTQSTPGTHGGVHAHLRQQNPPISEQPVPLGGNLIVIQPLKPSEDLNKSHQISSMPESQNFPRKTSENLSPQTEKEVPPKPKLSLPQDRYHSSQSSSCKEQTKKVSDEKTVEKKPKDKFSRYDKSDSEDEDDWMDNYSEVDDIAMEIDKFLQEADDSESIVPQKEIVKEVKVETPEKNTEKSTSVPNISPIREDEDSHHSSPAQSEPESLDLDALANGDPVIGDFEDLDFLVDQEPVTSCIHDDSSNCFDRNDDSSKSGPKKVTDSIKNASPISLSSPLSSQSPTTQTSLNDHRLNEKGDSGLTDKRTSEPQSSKDSIDDLIHAKSPSPIKSLSGDKIINEHWRRSPHNESSRLRSRSPYTRRDSVRRSPRRRSISPRRSPPRRQWSPNRGRSPQRSLPSLRRSPQLSLSPRRMSPFRRQELSSRRRPIHSRRSVSPQGRRQSPHGQSLSPRRPHRYEDSRDRRGFEYSRNSKDRSRYGARSRDKSPSPSSRFGEKGKWMGPRVKSPDRHERPVDEKLRDDSSRGSIQGKEDPSKGLFMDEKDLKKLSPEERAKVEARRRKFATKEEVKLENANKTVSLKSIKERKKKSKKGDKNKGGPLDAPLEESSPKKNEKTRISTSKKNEKSGISLKELRKKQELKKVQKEGVEEQSEEESTANNDPLAALDDDSEDSDSGRAWRTEESKAKPLKSVKYGSKSLNKGLDELDPYQRRIHRGRDYSRTHHQCSLPRKRSPPSRARRRDVPLLQKKRDVEGDDKEDNPPSSRLGSSIVNPHNRFTADIPPEQLRVQIQVSSSMEKKKKKSKSKPDFTHIYSVPAKRGASDQSDGEEVHETIEVVPKKKARKKEKKKKSKVERENPEERISSLSTEHVPQQRPSVLDRLGKKVELDVIEKKKKKKKSKLSLMDDDADDLDQHIQKMKLKNAAILQRQKEIQLDKERYG